jgi:hypothetical protein
MIRTIAGQESAGHAAVACRGRGLGSILCSDRTQRTHCNRSVP